MNKSSFQISKGKNESQTNTVHLYPGQAGCLAVAQNLQIFARLSPVNSLTDFCLAHTLQKDGGRLG